MYNRIRSWFLMLLMYIFPLSGTFAQVDDTQIPIAQSEETNHDFFIGVLIFIIVIVQILVFWWTQKRIVAYRSGIDQKNKYKTIKIRIPLRWAERYGLEYILAKKEKYQIPNEYHSSADLNDSLRSENRLSAKTQREDSENITNSQIIEDGLNSLPTESIEASELIDFEENEHFDEGGNYIMIKKIDGGIIQTKRIKEKNYEKYEREGWTRYE